MSPLIPLSWTVLVFSHVCLSNIKHFLPSFVDVTEVTNIILFHVRGSNVAGSPRDCT